MYMQFEEAKLCIKICPDLDETGKRSEIRNICYRKLLETADDRFPELHKPTRFGTGTYMTIAVVDPENIFGNGVFDINAMVARLKQYESLVDECCRKK